ncbi:DUF748 domain-containing protein, partial [Pseudomonas aeruginosa]
MKKRYALPLRRLAALLLLLLALHLALPYLVRDYLNGKLADMGDYRGHIADVDLALWDDHAVVARVVFERPQLNFVDAGGDRDASQTGAGTDWR